MISSSTSPATLPVSGASAGYVRATSLAFWGVHVAAVIGVIALGWSWSGAALALGSYFVRMIVVTAGYHRYFAHSSFKTSRAFQFLLAVATQSAAQKRRALVGQPPPVASQVLGHAQGRSLRALAWVLFTRTSAGS